jgi:hypothetical protein
MPEPQVMWLISLATQQQQGEDPGLLGKTLAGSKAAVGAVEPTEPESSDEHQGQDGNEG